MESCIIDVRWIVGIKGWEERRRMGRLVLIFLRDVSIYVWEYRSVPRWLFCMKWAVCTFATPMWSWGWRAQVVGVVSGARPGRWRLLYKKNDARTVIWMNYEGTNRIYAAYADKSLHWISRIFYHVSRKKLFRGVWTGGGSGQIRYLITVTVSLNKVRNHRVIGPVVLWLWKSLSIFKGLKVCTLVSTSRVVILDITFHRVAQAVFMDSIRAVILASTWFVV